MQMPQPFLSIRTLLAVAAAGTGLLGAALIVSGAVTVPTASAAGGSANGVAVHSATATLTDAQIEAQNQMAVNVMNEQAMQPKVLADGTKEFDFTASTFQWALYPGKTEQAWGINQQVPGPVIRLTVGDKVKFVVHNDLPEPTTIHWHGLAVPNDMDGVPDMPVPPIPQGGFYTYSFTVTKQMVGTHWYHSHYDDDFQVDSGMNGVMIVDPADTSTLPHHDEDALFVLGATKVDGVDPENAFTIDGKSYPYAPQLTVHKGDKVLLRLVNTSAESYHAMTLDGYTLTIVAQDGQPLPDPEAVSVVSIAPSETVDVTFTANQTGDWLFHDTIQGNLTNPDDKLDTLGGAETVIHVK